MAKQGTADELDLGIEKNASSKKKLIIIILAAVLILGGVGGAIYFFLFSGEGASEESAQGEQTAETRPDEDREPAIYHPLDPLFVVNLEGRPKMLQVGIQLMTRNSDLVEFLEQNDPMVRDRVLSLLMAQQGSKLKSREGKEALQTELTAQIQEVINQQGAEGEIEALYFTSFVMQ